MSICITSYFHKIMYRALGIRYQVPGIGYMGAEYWVSGTGYQVLGTRYRAPFYKTSLRHILTRIFGPRFAWPQFEHITKKHVKKQILQLR